MRGFVTNQHDMGRMASGPHEISRFPRMAVSAAVQAQFRPAVKNGLKLLCSTPLALNALRLVTILAFGGFGSIRNKPQRLRGTR